jgi:hypothetical protein
MANKPATTCGAVNRPLTTAMPKILDQRAHWERGESQNLMPRARLYAGDVMRMRTRSPIVAREVARGARNAKYQLARDIRQPSCKTACVDKGPPKSPFPGS